MRATALLTVLFVTLMTNGSLAQQEDPAKALLGKWFVTYLDGWKSKFDYKTSIILSRPTINIMAEGKVSGTNGCNGYFGTYKIDGSHIKFSGFRTTRKFCRGTGGKISRKFTDAKNNVRSIVLKPGHLVLLDQNRKAMLVLSRISPATGQ